MSAQMLAIMSAQMLAHDGISTNPCPDLLSRVSSGSTDVAINESVIPRVGVPLPGC